SHINNYQLNMEDFIAGDNLSSDIRNYGYEESSGSIGNLVSLFYHHQFGINSCEIGNHATISILNNGIAAGSSTVSNRISSGDYQFSSGTFNAGDYLTFNIANNGLDKSSNNSSSIN